MNLISDTLDLVVRSFHTFQTATISSGPHLLTSRHCDLPTGGNWTPSVSLLHPARVEGMNSSGDSLPFPGN